MVWIKTPAPLSSAPGTHMPISWVKVLFFSIDTKLPPLKALCFITHLSQTIVTDLYNWYDSYQIYIWGLKQATIEACQLQQNKKSEEGEVTRVCLFCASSVFLNLLSSESTEKVIHGLTRAP